MNTQLRAYEDPEPRVPALPQYNSMPTLSPPHTPVSPQRLPGDVSMSDSLLDFVYELNNLPPQRLPGDDLSDMLTDSDLDFIFEVNNE
jgi:hypothetical protein